MSPITKQVASTEEALRELTDKLEIMELVGSERLWRDTGQWDKLAKAYTDDARVKTTWFDGTAKEFLANSRGRSQLVGEMKHPIVPIYVQIVGDRALVESRAQIQNRSQIKSVWLDLTQHVRFVSRVRRTPDSWRLESLEGIYEKGTVSPVNPDERLPFEWSEVESAVDRPSYQLWAWLMGYRGHKVDADLLGDDRPDELRAFYTAEEQWLQSDD